MKNRIFALVSASFAVASVVACSSSSNGGSSNPADACTSYGNALVAYTAKCSGTLDPAQSSAIVARYSKLCQAEISLPGVSANTASQISACASAVSSAACNANVENICTIDEVGTLADGATCSEDLQCSSGSCNVKSTPSGGGDAGPSAATNCGKCVPAIADGADCSSGGTCVQGDTCTYNSGSDGSFTAKCTAKGSGADVGASCTDTNECKTPNHCKVTFTNGAQTGTCTAPIAAGGACEESLECATGFDCAGPDSARVCTAPAAEGAACTGGDCSVGLACNNTTSKCEKISFAAVGKACNGTSILCSQGQCNLGSSTDGTGTCPTIIADDGACNSSDSSAQCDEFADCENGKCVLVPATCN